MKKDEDEEEKKVDEGDDKDTTKKDAEMNEDEKVTIIKPKETQETYQAPKRVE